MAQRTPVILSERRLRWNRRGAIFFTAVFFAAVPAYLFAAVHLHSWLPAFLVPHTLWGAIGMLRMVRAEHGLFSANPAGA